LKERDPGRLVDIDPQTPSFVRYSRRRPQITNIRPVKRHFQLISLPGPIRIIQFAAARLCVSSILLSVRLAQRLAGVPPCVNNFREGW